MNLGEEPSKRFSEAAGSVFWVSLPALPGDTGPNYCDRGKQLTTVSFVEVASVAGAWKYLGSRKTRRARGLSGRRSLSPRVSPSRVPFFLAPTTSKRLLRRLCWGSSFFQRDIISALSLGRGHILVHSLSVRSHRLPSNLRNLDFFLRTIYLKSRVVFHLRGGGAQG